MTIPKDPVASTTTNQLSLEQFFQNHLETLLSCSLWVDLNAVMEVTELAGIRMDGVTDVTVEALGTIDTIAGGIEMMGVMEETIALTGMVTEVMGDDFGTIDVI